MSTVIPVAALVALAPSLLSSSNTCSTVYGWGLAYIDPGWTVRRFIARWCFIVYVSLLFFLLLEDKRKKPAHTMAYSMAGGPTSYNVPQFTMPQRNSSVMNMGPNAVPKPAPLKIAKGKEEEEAQKLAMTFCSTYKNNMTNGSSGGHTGVTVVQGMEVFEHFLRSCFKDTEFGGQLFRDKDDDDESSDSDDDA